ncbi:MAG TPA: VOC family protein [Solirubrobacterales bacterium]|nr:VOC family protein [Solirubrobacterales bacterium]
MADSGSDHGPHGALRRLDHVAVLVEDTERTLSALSSDLGLEVVADEVLEDPPVRLSYVDCGNVLLQLVEPLDPASPIGTHLRERGEGLHHICFAVENVPETAAALAPLDAPPPTIGQGRGRRSAFVPGLAPAGVPIELTELRPEDPAG